MALDLTENGYADLFVVNHKTYGNHVGSSWIWWGSPAGLAEERRTELPSRGPHGISHQDVGNIMDRGHEEFYVSRVLELGDAAELESVLLRGTVPIRTWVRVDYRATVSTDTIEHAKWIPLVEEAPLRFLPTDGNLRGGFAQYRLSLGAWNGVNTPRIAGVEMQFA